MGYEIEFKLIEIKDINKIQRVEEVEDSSFGETVKVECKHDIADGSFSWVQMWISVIAVVDISLLYRMQCR